MANTLTFTNLAPEMYKAMDIVGRELTGVVPSAMVNTSGDNVTTAAFGDKVKSMRTQEASVSSSRTPAMAIPATSDITVDEDEFALDQTAGTDIPITGETWRKLNNSFGGERARLDLFTQMIRKVTNTVEAYAAGVVYKSASRAYGTAGTTPFATNFDDIGQIRKILVDNGCPTDNEISLVLNTAAGAKLRSLAQLQKANESGGTELLRRGTLLDLLGIMIKESAGIQNHTKGTGTGYDCTAVEPVKETTIAVDGGDSGTILAGDIITLANDTNKYVVASATASGAASGNIVINRPGLLEASSIGEEITIGGNYAANVAFHRAAVEVAMRAPAEPPSGLSQMTDEFTLVDPLTGLTYVFRAYPGYGMGRIELYVYYGVKVWKPDFVAILLG